MLSLAKSPLAPVLGKHVPLRGSARILFSSYTRTHHQPQRSVARVTTEVGDVFDADLSSALEWQLWAFGHYEPHFAELFRLLVKPGDRCVDVGANVGVHTVRLGHLAGEDGEVIAIEPDPGVAQRAQRNIALNGLANVRVVNAAASDKAGKAELYRPGPWDTNRGRASLLHHAYLTGATISVPAVTVDEVCGGDRVALIKVDVEGHEGAVVRGAAGTIERDAPSVIFEYAPELLDDPAQSPFEWLADRGYVMFAVRAARHGVTGRMRLALDPVRGRLPRTTDFLAVSSETAASLAGFQGLGGRTRG
jgi:FkbM family methyltransferase